MSNLRYSSRRTRKRLRSSKDGPSLIRFTSMATSASFRLLMHILYYLTLQKETLLAIFPWWHPPCWLFCPFVDHIPLRRNMVLRDLLRETRRRKGGPMNQLTEYKIAYQTPNLNFKMVFTVQTHSIMSIYEMKCFLYNVHYFFLLYQSFCSQNSKFSKLKTTKLGGIAKEKNTDPIMWIKTNLRFSG